MSGDRLTIFDTTLRDGEQAPGFSLRIDEKLKIAYQLRSLGVDIIEAGFPVSSNGDWESVHAIAAEITNSTVCGLARSPIGPVRNAPLGALLIERAGREIAAVARAMGITLREGEEEQVVERLSALPAGFRPSFLLDLERGGPDELEILSGAVSRFGRDRGVATPIHDAVVTAVAANRSRMAV